MNPVVMNGTIETRFLSVLQWLTSMFSKDDIMPTMLQSFDPLAASKNTNYVTLCQKYINTSSIAADPTLNLIGQNDAFAPVAIRQVFRKRYVAATYANCEVVAYPDKYIFDFTGELAQINSAFNGSRSALQVETTTVIEALLGPQLGYAGTPQQAAATVSATGAASTYDRFVNLYKDMILSGATNVQLVTSLLGFTPAAAITGDTGEANDIGFQLLGFTIKGAAQKVNDLAGNQKCLVR